MSEIYFISLTKSHRDPLHKEGHTRDHSRIFEVYYTPQELNCIQSSKANTAEKEDKPTRLQGKVAKPVLESSGINKSSGILKFPVNSTTESSQCNYAPNLAETHTKPCTGPS